MRLVTAAWVLFLGALQPSSASQITERSVEYLKPRTYDTPTCSNSPSNRQCWDAKTNIWTSYEDLKKVPRGEVRKYELTITNQYLAADGYNITRMLVNGQYPGPKIEGNWGDHFEITVHNKLTNHNGTSMHWHGLHHYGTNHMDGVSGVTQCPIPPGETMVYKWRATQYGTSWYHSHFALQYTEGVAGPIVIHGPTSANYDEEYTLMLNDWYHGDPFTLFYQEVFGTAPPFPESKLLNGQWKFQCNTTDKACIPEEGGYSEIVFQKGKKYKLRLINASTAFHYTFWLDKHNFRVVAADFVPIHPYKSDVLNIGAGQRYDIIIEANADITKESNFWINAKWCNLKPGETCSPEDARLGIVRYDADSTDLPPTLSNCPNTYACRDEPKEFLKPIIPWKVPPPPGIPDSRNLYVSLDSWPDENVPFPQSKGHKWNLANSTFAVDWQKPTYTYMGLESKQETFPNSYQTIYLDKKDEWVYLVIHANFTPTHPGKIPIPADHPIHLHGHDFAILAQVPVGDYDKHPVKLELDNPMRRDVALLPGGGYLVIAFKTTNPGVWLLHCHIAFHASGGLALQIVERQNEIFPQISEHRQKSYKKQCEKWRKSWEVSPWKNSLPESGA